MVQVHSKCSASLFVVLYLHSCAGYCAVSVVGGQGVNNPRDPFSPNEVGVEVGAVHRHLAPFGLVTATRPQGHSSHFG